jgi:hypothetical protein
MQSGPYSYQILITFGFCRSTSRNSPNIKFHGNLSSGSREYVYGQTDGRTWRNEMALFATIRTRPKANFQTRATVLTLLINTLASSNCLIIKMTLRTSWSISPSCFYAITDVRFASRNKNFWAWIRYKLSKPASHTNFDNTAELGLGSEVWHLTDCSTNTFDLMCINLI